MTRFAEAALAAGRAACSILGWKPGEFWQATPAELALALSAIGGANHGEGAPPLTASELRRLEHEHG
jgi:hypothetical protein